MSGQLEMFAPTRRRRGWTTTGLCPDHDQPVVGVLRSSRGGEVPVCRELGCSAWHATAWSLALPQLWCDRMTGELECHRLTLNRHCYGCEPSPGYDYLDPGGIWVELAGAA